MISTLKLFSSIVGTAVVLGLTAPAQANLINYSFEESPGVGKGNFSLLNESDVNGWQTTDRKIEIWGDGFEGVSAVDGDYFAEINAYIDGTLFQDISGIGAEEEVDFYFYHRARSGTDVMNLAITDFGTDNLFGTEDDTVLFSKDYSATTENWVLNNSDDEAVIKTLGNSMRFAYSAVSTGSNNSSIGNFIDAANFGVSIAPPPTDPAKDVPEPTSALAILAVGAISIGSRLKKK